MTQPSSSLSATARTALLPVLIMLGVVAVWEAALPWFSVSPHILPRPSEIARELSTSSDILWSHTLVTLREILIGFAAGTIIGVALAVLIARSDLLERTLYPIIVFLHTVPKLAIAPIFVIWFGYGLLPKVLLVIVISFFPVTVNMIYGLTSVDHNIISLMRSVSASEWQILKWIRLPNSVPYLFAGLKISVTLAVVGAIIGEWVGTDAGLGFAILVSATQLNTPFMFASITIISVMGVALFYLVALTERLLIPWQEPKDITRTAGL
jgi:NitT/TauT family transport system permease protein